MERKGRSTTISNPTVVDPDEVDLVPVVDLAEPVTPPVILAAASPTVRIAASQPTQQKRQ